MNEIQKPLIVHFVELDSTKADLHFLVCVAFCYVLLHFVNELLDWIDLRSYVSSPRNGHHVQRVGYPSHRNHPFDISFDFFIFKGLNSSPNGCEWEQVTTVFDLPLLEKVDCEIRWSIWKLLCGALSSVLVLNEILVSLHPIYRGGRFWMVSFVEVRDNAIRHKKNYRKRQ